MSAVDWSTRVHYMENEGTGKSDAETRIEIGLHKISLDQMWQQTGRRQTVVYHRSDRRTWNSNI